MLFCVNVFSRPLMDFTTSGCNSCFKNYFGVIPLRFYGMFAEVMLRLLSYTGMGTFVTDMGSTLDHLLNSWEDMLRKKQKEQKRGWLALSALLRKFRLNVECALHRKFQQICQPNAMDGSPIDSSPKTSL